MNTFFVFVFAVLGFFLFVPSAHAQIPGQSTQYTCPVGSTQVGATQDTGCPLCRHGVTGEVFSVAACSSGAACKQASECVGLDETCPINETFLRWECSTADNTTSHCVKYCSGVPGGFRSDSNETKTGVGEGSVPGARPDDYRAALIEEFGITMNGFSQENMMWAWEFMHKVDGSNFPRFVRGTVVGVDNSGSHMTGCKTIFLRSTYPTYEYFAPIFAHELGHVVYHCSDGGSAKYRKMHLEALEKEGPLTPYSKNLCYYKSPSDYSRETENFAEMVAYYLNPTLGAVTGCGSGPNPFANGGHPAHMSVANTIFK